MEAGRNAAHDEHVPALDGLRGVAILLVLAYHSLGLRADPDDAVLRWIGRAGWVGVDLFFVLSGFLITEILIDKVSRLRGLRAFYARRALRIFPLYYLFLAVVFGLGAIVPALHTEGFQRVADHQGWLWLYASNIKMAITGDPGVFGWEKTGWVETTHFWTLAIEEQFYLIWPVLILALPSRWRVATIAVVCLAAPSLRALLVWNGNEIAAYVSMPCRMDALGAGALVAVARSRQGFGSAELRLARRLALATGLAALTLGVLRGGYENLDPAIVVLGYSLNAVFFAAVVALCVGLPASHRMIRALSGRGLRGIGRVSYGIYVLHLPLVKLLFVSPGWEHPAASWAGGTALFLALTLVSLLVAWLVFALWERPFLKLKRRFPYPTTTGPGAAQAGPSVAAPQPPPRREASGS
jgi:peptidoglycan/LPS O-acetylase OafA/YrhL